MLPVNEDPFSPIVGVHIADSYELMSDTIYELIGENIVSNDYTACLKYIIKDYTSYLVNMFSFEEHVAFFMLKDIPSLIFHVGAITINTDSIRGTIVSYMVQLYEYLRKVVGVIPNSNLVYHVHNYNDGHFTITVKQRLIQS